MRSIVLAGLMLPPKFKPLLATLLLPPALPLLIGATAMLAILAGARWVVLPIIGLVALVSLWLSCCNAVALWLEGRMLVSISPISPGAVAGLFASNGIQAIVALGSGVHYQTPEYGGEPMLAEQSQARLRYALRLAKATGVPVAFAGGTGWARGKFQLESEAGVAARVARYDHGQPIRWIDDESQDTFMNAMHMARLLGDDGIRRIALVTHGWHMRRAMTLFRQAGFDVTPAPTGLLGTQQTQLLEWLPSAHGLFATRTVLREYMALGAIWLRQK